MMALVAVLLTFVWRVQDLFGMIRYIKPGLVVPVVAVIAFLVTSDRRRKIGEVLRIPVVKIGLLITLCIALSIPGSLWPGLSARFLMRDFFPNIAIMIVMAASVRAFVDVERLALAQLLGATLMAGTLLKRFSVGSSGRLGFLGYYDANDFAMLIVCSIPIAIYFAQRRAQTKWPRLMAIGALGLLVVGLVKTGSRGGFLAFVAVGLYLLFFFTAVKARVRFGAVAALILMMLVAGNETYWGFIKTLADPTADYNWSGQSEGGRMEVWKRGMGYMKSHPLLGTGARTFPIAEGRLSPMAYLQDYGRGVKWTAAHNSFVEIGVEVGVPALLLFISLIGVGMKTAWSRRRGLPPDGEGGKASGPLGQALGAGLIGYAVAAFFLSQAYAAWLYATIGIIAGYAKLIPGKPRRRRTGAFPAAVPVVSGLPGQGS